MLSAILRTTFVLLAFLFGRDLAAQTLTRADWPFQQGTFEVVTLEADSASVAQHLDLASSLIDQTGEDLTFDLTPFRFDTIGVGTMHVHDRVADAPFGERAPFSDANRVVEGLIGPGKATRPSARGADDQLVEQAGYTFLHVTDDAAFMLGTAFVFDIDDDGDPDTVTTGYLAPGLKNTVFPLAFGSTWQSTYETFLEFGGNPDFEGEGLETTSYNVDGAGTLTAPGLSGSAACLRLTHAVDRDAEDDVDEADEISYEWRCQGGRFSATLRPGDDFLGEPPSLELSFITPLASPTPTERPDAWAGAHLHPNTPNPFNPQTTLRFDLPKAAHVRLTIYDLLGRARARLVDAMRPPGTHEVAFDATGLPSGTYLYRLEAGDYVKTKTMTLLR